MNSEYYERTNNQTEDLYRRNTKKPLEWKKAAFVAGYNEKSAGVMACRLLKNPQIAEKLEKRTVDIVHKADVEIGEIV